MSNLKITNITKQAIKLLKQTANQQKAIIQIGSNGLSDSVIKEIENTLNYHELLKIKINYQDKSELNAIAKQIIRLTKATTIQEIGKTLVIFRKAKKNSKFPYINNLDISSNAKTTT